MPVMLGAGRALHYRGTGVWLSVERKDNPPSWVLVVGVKGALTENACGDCTDAEIDEAISLWHANNKVVSPARTSSASAERTNYATQVRMNECFSYVYGGFELTYDVALQVVYARDLTKVGRHVAVKSDGALTHYSHCWLPASVIVEAQDLWRRCENRSPSVPAANYCKVLGGGWKLTYYSAENTVHVSWVDATHGSAPLVDSDGTLMPRRWTVPAPVNTAALAFWHEFQPSCPQYCAPPGGRPGFAGLAYATRSGWPEPTVRVQTACTRVR